MLEVHDSGPVIGQILLESASRARCQLRKIIVWVHGNVESVVGVQYLISKFHSINLRILQRVKSMGCQLYVGLNVKIWRTPPMI